MTYYFLFQETGTSLRLLIYYRYSQWLVLAIGFVVCKTLVCQKDTFFHTEEGVQQDLNAYSLATHLLHQQVQLL